MGIQFVKPESVQIPISDGDYILIKQRLTHGERDDMMARIMPTLTPGQPLTVDAKEVRTAKVLTYLVGWSAPLPIGPEVSYAVRRDTLRGLSPETFDEIDRAIDTHVAAMAAEKNGTGGALESSAISPSPSAVTGDIAMSVS